MGGRAIVSQFAISYVAASHLGHGGNNNLVAVRPSIRAGRCWRWASDVWHSELWFILVDADLV